MVTNLQDKVFQVILQIISARALINATPYHQHASQDRGRGTGGGEGALGASAPPLFVPGEKVPFLGMKVPCFHRIEVPFLQNLSALFGQCPFWSVPPHFRGAFAASVPGCPPINPARPVL